MPVLDTVEMTVTVQTEDVLESIRHGFRMAWIDGVEGGFQISLTAGAGCGNKWLSLSIRLPDGEHVYESIDMASMLQDWYTSALERHVERKAKEADVRTADGAGEGPVGDDPGVRG
jgi:hypothetical protein